MGERLANTAEGDLGGHLPHLPGEVWEGLSEESWDQKDENCEDLGNAPGRGNSPRPCGGKGGACSQKREKITGRSSVTRKKLVRGGGGVASAQILQGLAGWGTELGLTLSIVGSLWNVWNRKLTHGIGRSLWLWWLGRRGEHKEKGKLRNRWEVTAIAQVRMEMVGRIPQEPAPPWNLPTPKPLLSESAVLSLLAAPSGAPSWSLTIPCRLYHVGSVCLKEAGWRLLREAIDRNNGHGMAMFWAPL